MPYFALTDSDWPWDDQDEGRAIIVKADTPEEAVTKATELHLAECHPMESGGVGWKIAQLWNVGLQGVTYEDGKVTEVDEFNYYGAGCNGRLFNGDGPKSDVRTLELDDAEAEALRDA